MWGYPGFLRFIFTPSNRLDIQKRQEMLNTRGTLSFSFRINAQIYEGEHFLCFLTQKLVSTLSMKPSSWGHKQS